MKEELPGAFWQKRNDNDQIWWLANTGEKGNCIFSFDKKKKFFMYRSYPWELSGEQRRIFDEENPFWAKFFARRTDGWDKIDTTFDFTSELPHYWEGFWDRKDGLGEGGCDPDSQSQTLQEYHRILWSRPLPDGKHMNLNKESDSSGLFLSWDGMRFSSDSILTTFRYRKYREIIDEIKSIIPNYKEFYEELIRRFYTIGGMIIFPRHRESINQKRGTIPAISDRWDLTLECIRRYYSGETSPLTGTIERDKRFFDMFVDFKGYVDFFFLQDCVSGDYSKVDIWCGDDSFKSSGLPNTSEEYLRFIQKEIEFLDKRNDRIKEYFGNSLR